jgi:hypothetical protein
MFLSVLLSRSVPIGNTHAHIMHPRTPPPTPTHYRRNWVYKVYSKYRNTDAGTYLEYTFRMCVFVCVCARARVWWCVCVCVCLYFSFSDFLPQSSNPHLCVCKYNTLNHVLVSACIHTNCSRLQEAIPHVIHATHTHSNNAYFTDVCERERDRERERERERESVCVLVWGLKLLVYEALSYLCMRPKSY